MNATAWRGGEVTELDPIIGELIAAPAYARDQLRQMLPSAPGVYGMWFRSLPGEIDVQGCLKRDDGWLLYLGISPSSPTSGGQASSQTLRERVRAHFDGNANSSTLRKTLGCLLAEELQLELRRVGAGARMTFTKGEPRLSAWFERNVTVSWVVHERPWEIESKLISSLDLPLNLRGNERSEFARKASAARVAAIAHARTLPVVRPEST